mmetsp:Transcript_14857/g.25190  ORF Transcript_14857/g.25190 Transcript_14857/m.25190 type:complete len:411 (-) Transcript_14857:556-1788(-)|eukprot:CAMPEP_0116547988 /NCGR_PEP_ID=MMETSP0397-20121206/4078_1 /TAXON_ID=216820 /ORGANISM="Cyclophora tenuis, Strain ECT3854" /LENGTH=410 /DNA_ID=CAMNT_0004072571 /DNA_START=221 /DNA_END=1453 /DNA_ORIENTATION=+
MPEHDNSSGGKASQESNGDSGAELLSSAPPLSGDLDDIFDDGDDHGASFNDGDTPLDEPSPQQLSSLLGGSSSDPFGDPFANHVGSSDSDDLKNANKGPKVKVESSNHKDSSSGWQDDVADIPHRRELIRQIAQLLRDRKQHPTQKWLKELPYKARKLEEQLYKSAQSLEAYLDKSTLKHRLKRVAHAITSQFRLTKGGKSLGSRRSSKSRSSISSEISTGSNNNSSGGGMPDISALEQQQAVNQKLQEQILENIRQQQQIMRNLMQQPSQQQPQQLQQQQQQQDPTANMMAAVQQQSPMNLSMANPLMMQQAAFMNAGGMVRGATPQQMAMMNPMLRNQMNPGINTGMMGMNLGNVIPPQPMNTGMNSGIHPTMPPPNMASFRTSFSNGTGNPNGADDNMSLSPNSFKW